MYNDARKRRERREAAVLAAAAAASGRHSAPSNAKKRPDRAEEDVRARPSKEAHHSPTKSHLVKVLSQPRMKSDRNQYDLPSARLPSHSAFVTSLFSLTAALL